MDKVKDGSRIAAVLFLCCAFVMHGMIDCLYHGKKYHEFRVCCSFVVDDMIKCI